jgi:hypothetical protein
MALSDTVKGWGNELHKKINTPATKESLGGVAARNYEKFHAKKQQVASKMIGKKIILD